VTAASVPTVVVWACRTDRASLDAERYAPLVPPSRAARARRLRTSRARAEALVAAAFLHCVLAEQTGSAPAELALSTRCAWCGDPGHGKPALALAGSGPAPRFSLAHTRGLALLAVSAIEVGIDVEHRGAPGVSDGGELVLSEEELDALPSDGAALERAYLGLWTRKESYLKGLGLGLERDPRQVTFATAAGPWSAVVDDGAPTTWSSSELELDDPWLGALAIDAPHAHVHYEIWPGL
jgi:4'-phosphopantetheinyl transferase